MRKGRRHDVSNTLGQLLAEQLQTRGYASLERPALMHYRPWLPALGITPHDPWAWAEERRPYLAELVSSVTYIG